MNINNRQRLIGRIECCMDSVIDTFSKSDILSYCNSDWDTAEKCIQEWAFTGKIFILKPLNEASNDDLVIKMKSYIEGNSPWPNWPRKI